MPITVGDRIQSSTVLHMGENGPEEIDVAKHISGKRVVIFGLPGAFTSTCSMAHLPSFIRTYEAFKEKGIDEIICVSVNDVFVMAKWGETTGATEAGITMLADWSSAFGKSIGLTFDAPPRWLHPAHPALRHGRKRRRCRSASGRRRARCL